MAGDASTPSPRPRCHGDRRGGPRGRRGNSKTDVALVGGLFHRDDTAFVERIRAGIAKVATSNS